MAGKNDVELDVGINFKLDNKDVSGFINNLGKNIKPTNKMVSSSLSGISERLLSDFKKNKYTPKQQLEFFNNFKESVPSFIKNFNKKTNSKIRTNDVINAIDLKTVGILGSLQEKINNDSLKDDNKKPRISKEEKEQRDLKNILLSKFKEEKTAFITENPKANTKQTTDFYNKTLGYLKKDENFNKLDQKNQKELLDKLSESQAKSLSQSRDPNSAIFTTITRFLKGLSILHLAIQGLKKWLAINETRASEGIEMIKSGLTIDQVGLETAARYSEESKNAVMNNDVVSGQFSTRLAMGQANPAVFQNAHWAPNTFNGIMKGVTGNALTNLIRTDYRNNPIMTTIALQNMGIQLPADMIIASDKDLVENELFAKATMSPKGKAIERKNLFEATTRTVGDFFINPYYNPNPVDKEEIKKEAKERGVPVESVYKERIRDAELKIKARDSLDDSKYNPGGKLYGAVPVDVTIKNDSKNEVEVNGNSVKSGETKQATYSQGGQAK